MEAVQLASEFSINTGSEIADFRSESGRSNVTRQDQFVTGAAVLAASAMVTRQFDHCRLQSWTILKSSRATSTSGIKSCLCYLATTITSFGEDGYVKLASMSSLFSTL